MRRRAGNEADRALASIRAAQEADDVAARARDRANLRSVERMVDLELHRKVTTTGRIWSEHERGFHGRCAECPRIGRRWVGSYFVYVTGPRTVPYSIHRSQPLCAFHTIALQRAEMEAGIGHWRAAPAAQLRSS